MRSTLALALGLALTWVGPAQAAPKDEARRAFNEGLELIAAGDYQAGILRFEQAYELVPHPAVLYNIARAYADSGQYERAIAAFERYLETEPIDRSEVEGYIATLRSRLDEAEVVEETPPATGARGYATEAELAELRRHAEELQALATRLAEREQAVVEAPAITTGPELVDPVVVPDEVVALEGALVEDLYERVVVTASRYGQDPLDAPAAITILTAEDIQLSAASSIPELLARVPGMDVMQLTAGQADVSARGFNRRLSNKLLVLVDGRSVYLDFIGSTVWASLPVTLDEIERIEVIRGPGSAIYGANAFAGVVNIITKTPGDPDNQDSLRVTAGSRASGGLSAVVSGREDDLGYRFSTEYQQHGRWAQEVDLDARPELSSPVADQTRSLEVYGGNAQLDWRLGQRGFASLSGGANKGFVEFYSLGALRNFFLDQQNEYVRGDLGWGPLHGRVFYNHLAGEAGNWYNAAGADELRAPIASHVLDATVDGNFHFGAEEQHTLLVGLNYRLKDVQWGFLDEDRRQHHYSGFVQEESRFGPLTTNAAVRVDKHPYISAPIPSPRLAVVGHLGEGRSLRVNAGTAFRTPTFMESHAELYIPTDIDGVLVNSNGDPELEPERIASVELGYLDHSSDLFRAEAVVYGFQVDRLIDLGPVDPSRTVDGFDESVGAYVAGDTTFINEDPSYRALGAELGVEFFGVAGLDTYANYALERITLVDGASRELVLSTPRHKVNGGVAWRSPWTLDLGMDLHWVDKQVWGIRGFDDAGQVQVVPTDLSSRLILANKLIWHVPAGHRRVEISAQAWNWLADLGSAQAQHPLGQPVGSRYSASLGYRF